MIEYDVVENGASMRLMEIVSPVEVTLDIRTIRDKFTGREGFGFDCSCDIWRQKLTCDHVEQFLHEPILHIFGERGGDDKTLFVPLFERPTRLFLELDLNSVDEKVGMLLIPYNFEDSGLGFIEVGLVMNSGETCNSLINRAFDTLVVEEVPTCHGDFHFDPLTQVFHGRTEHEMLEAKLADWWCLVTLGFCYGCLEAEYNMIEIAASSL